MTFINNYECVIALEHRILIDSISFFERIFLR